LPLIHFAMPVANTRDDMRVDKRLNTLAKIFDF
jgi:hypothetical protein